MTEPPKLQQLQIRDPNEICNCGHQRRLHARMSPGLHDHRADPCLVTRCTCTTFRPADDQEPKPSADAGSA